jgi:hypothetical protein
MGAEGEGKDGAGTLKRPKFTTAGLPSSDFLQNFCSPQTDWRLTRNSRNPLKSETELPHSAQGIVGAMGFMDDVKTVRAGRGSAAAAVAVCATLPQRPSALVRRGFALPCPRGAVTE